MIMNKLLCVALFLGIISASLVFYKVKTAKPEEYAELANIELPLEEPNGVWGAESFDPNLLEFSHYYDDVIFYVNNDKWAEFNTIDDGVVACNISQAEFLEKLPEFLYGIMGEVDPNVQYVI